MHHERRYVNIQQTYDERQGQNNPDYGDDQPKSLKRNAFSASNAYMSPTVAGNKDESLKKVPLDNKAVNDRSNAAMRKMKLR